jgi:hypothetical protein
MGAAGGHQRRQALPSLVTRPGQAHRLRACSPKRARARRRRQSGAVDMQAQAGSDQWLASLDHHSRSAPLREIDGSQGRVSSRLDSNGGGSSVGARPSAARLLLLLVVVRAGFDSGWLRAGWPAGWRPNHCDAAKMFGKAIIGVGLAAGRRALRGLRMGSTAAVRVWLMGHFCAAASPAGPSNRPDVYEVGRWVG